MAKSKNIKKTITYVEAVPLLERAASLRKKGMPHSKIARSLNMSNGSYYEMRHLFGAEFGLSVGSVGRNKVKRTKPVAGFKGLPINAEIKRLQNENSKLRAYIVDRLLETL